MMQRSGPRRLLAATLTIVLLWMGPPAQPADLVFAAGATAPPVPVALIGEPGDFDGAGAAGWIASGLVTRLEQGGFIRGESLFILLPVVFEDFSDGSATLAGFINDCLSRSGSGEIDVIGCGVSGLLARLALEAGLVPAGAVRNLVMVSSPNRGTFAADLLKSIIEIVKHESLLEQETRAARYVPFGDEPPRKGSSQAGSSPVDPAASRAGTVWEDETSWVAARARDVYEPLYARYVQERFLSLPYVPVEAPKETFAGWVRRTEPDLWEESIDGGTLPPAESAFRSGKPLSTGSSASPSASLSRVPPAGTDLSSAYYEVLAMEVARNQYTMRVASRGNVVGSLTSPVFIPANWKEALVYYGIKVLGYYAQKALVTLKAEAQEFVAGKLVSIAGLTSGPDSPMLRRLLKDDLLVNLGTSVTQRFARLPANLYLAGLNRASQAAAQARATRYVSISGRLANPWSLVWPQLGPNDLFLEVDSSVSPAGPSDLVAVFPGLFAPSRSGLLGDVRVQDYILGVLHGGVAAAPGATEVTGVAKRVTVSSWRPAYVASGIDAAPPALAAIVAVPDPPEGWQYLLWGETWAATPEAPPGSPGPPDYPVLPQGVRVLTQGGTYRATLPEAGVLGLRLTRTGPANPVVAGTVGSAFAVEVRVPVTVAMATSGTEEGGIEPPAADAGEPAGEPASGPAAGDPSPVEPGTDDSPAAPAAPAAPGDIPLIRAVYRTKRTTLRNPAETYHEFWKVDFGDGTALEIQGSPALVLSHTFAVPGTYQVRATSIGNHGEELLTRGWAIEAPEAGASHQFSCSSLARVGADLSLTGPRKWVTGKPAGYIADLRLSLPQGVELVSLKYDPGAMFQVLWERAGDFTVSCAAVVKLRYLLEDKTLTVEDVFIRELSVTVLTTGVIR